MKRRFTTEKQLLDAIDHCHASAKEKLAKADQREDEAKQTFKLAYEKELELAAKKTEKDHHWAQYREVVNMQNRGNELLSEAQRLRKSASNVVENKAKRLGNKLSQIRTCLLPFKEKEIRVKDRSVPA